MACHDCIVSLRTQHGVRIVIRVFSGKVQVRSVVEIQVRQLA